MLNLFQHPLPFEQMPKQVRHDNTKENDQHYT